MKTLIQTAIAFGAMLMTLTATHAENLFWANTGTDFNAAGSFGALPARFNRGERGERLLAEVLAHPLLADTPLPFRAAVWLRAGEQAASAQRRDEARQWLQRVAASGAPQATQAQARLKAL